MTARNAESRNIDLLISQASSSLNINYHQQKNNKILSPKTVFNKTTTANSAFSIKKKPKESLKVRKKRACDILEEQLVKLKHDRISSPNDRIEESLLAGK